MKVLFDYIVSRLQNLYGLDEAKELAYWILEESTSMTRFEIMSCKGTKNIPNLEIILQRLLQKEPVQYIFGHTEWLGLDLLLSPATLIPRPETAELVEWVDLRCDIQDARVADLGTGSGCIAIALKKRRPQWEITAYDISEESLSLASQNALRNHVEIGLCKVDILTDEIRDFDCIISNPPYVLESERESMDARVVNYEPDRALFVPDGDPLLFYRRIVSIKKGKWLFFEINERFGNDVAQLMEENGYVDVEIQKDCYGKERMVSGRIKA